ncbi:MAG: hypothetical protein ACK5KU_07255 [Beutenbergiaceae bacterium]
MSETARERRVPTTAMIDLFRAVQRRLLLLTLALALLGSGLGLLLAGLAGLWGALLAAALGLAFTVTTVAMLRLVAGRGVEFLQIVLLGTWVMKLGLVVLVMVWLRGQEFYHRGVFFGVLVVVVLGAVGIEMWTVATSRMPTVDAPAEQVSRITPDAQDSEPAQTTDAEFRGEQPIVGRDGGDSDRESPAK